MLVYDNMPSHEKHYTARFYFDPNSVDLANGQGMYLFAGADEYWALCLYVDRQETSYRLLLCGEDDSLNWIENQYVYITDAWQAIEIEWQAASAPGANNGYMKLFVNDVLVDNIQNLDNDARSITGVEFGVDGIPAGTTGTVYFDAFESRRVSHIGPLAYSAPSLALAAANGFVQTASYHAKVVLPSLQLQQQSTPVTIDYVYDPLKRLTEANYSNGDYYHYTYDAVGNRLTQTSSIGGLVSTTTYGYDHANRLTTVNGVTYTWDNNGNLLSDGTNTYTYDSANRLVSVSNQSTVSSYQYNGMGDRLRQTVNGQTTNYTLDLNTGLTQVLDDGTYAYLYGNGRIAQVTTSIAEYFLGDALGGVRQLADSNAEITLARSYDPYGQVLSSAGSGTSAFAFTGEAVDSYIKLIYLRSRFYDPSSGRFLTKDPWQGNYYGPTSLNKWGYVEENPLYYTDSFTRLDKGA